MKSTDNKLTQQEQDQFAQCLEVIKKGPFNPATIGEALWLTDTHRLYRQSYGDAKSLYSAVTNREPEECAIIIEDWKQTPRGLEVTNGHPGIESGNGAHSAEPARKAPQSSSTKASGPKSAGAKDDVAHGDNDNPKPAAAEISEKHTPAQLQESGQASAVGASTSAMRGKPVTYLQLSVIKLDKSIQCRAAVDQKTVAYYADRIAAGDKFPPLMVVEVEGSYLLADGFHRHPAAVKAGLEKFPVEIRRGSRRDAIKFAIEANAAHGLTRSNKDKRRAVQMALAEFPDLSDGAIAELCKVSQPFVSSLRPKLKTVMSCKKRTGRDGKRRKVPKARCPAGGPQQRPASTEGRGDTSGSTAQTTESAAKAGAPQSQGNGSKNGTAHRKSFNISGAWAILEMLLLAHLKSWPTEHRQNLSGQLRKFADDNCS